MSPLPDVVGSLLNIYELSKGEFYTKIVFAGELTFELPDNERQCFFEQIEKGVQSTLEFQVISGGQYDVDMELTAPNGQVLYKDVKKQYDSFTWTPDQSGMETSAVNIHEDLRNILDDQTHHRLREAQGRVFAENLNDRVFYWSLGQSLIILFVGIGQVLVLRSFFTDKRTGKA
ncbi:TMED7 [Mytilus edulis]|uniref:TMED7 n=1 Tax=Mytilus edulis TaxID=6550 RepID=A0A8S3UD45_MYTED|nr:TMED7 [Mytilus edulis]